MHQPTGSSDSSSGPPQGGSGVPNGAVSEPPIAHRPYGIDTTTAGTIQERYFMVLAGLMQKSLEINREILGQLIALNGTIAPDKVSEIRPGGKKIR